jgi:uncharacterized membrane protein
MVTIPSLHAMLVHFPIALLLFASAAGLLYLYGWRRRELLTLTWWPMVAGWISLEIAIGSGLLAQSRLPPQSPYTGMLNWHISVGLAAMVVYATLLYRRWLHAKQAARRQKNGQAMPPELLDDPAARWWVTGLLAAGVALVVLSGWSGGQLVYRWGVNVLALMTR